MTLSEALKRFYLNNLFNSKKLKRYKRKGCNTIINKDSKVIVAALQVELKLHKTVASYFEHMESLAERAFSCGAQLMVYPENIHLPLYGLIPNIEGQFQNKSDSVDILNNGNKIRDSLMLIGPYAQRIYLETFRIISQNFGVYILAGSITAPKDGKLFNTSYLFDPRGQIIGNQRKLNPTPDEKAFGLEIGCSIEVRELPFGNIAYPVCMDATYYETFEIAREKGSDIVIIPIANNEPFEEFRALRGIWGRVQESRVYGIKSALVGKVASFDFTGKAGIYAPLDLTVNKDGIIKEAQHYYNDDVIVAELDIKKLRDYRENDPLLKDRNPELYRKYLRNYYCK
jgi:predicted amidohydrolase